MQMIILSFTITLRKVIYFNPISTGLFYLIVALGGVPTPSIKFDPDSLEH